MTTLTFVSLQADGTHLVLSDDSGHTFHLPITPELRAAIRKPVPHLSAPPSDTTLRPRDIQSMLRAGVSVAEVAAVGNTTEDHVRRFEGPIIAEREWAISQAQECAVGRELGSPTLGDLVVNRLAERGVDTEKLQWDAYREEGTAPWTVTVSYVAGEQERCARWRLDAQTSSVRALEDEARWLTESDSSSPRARRHTLSFLPDNGRPAPEPDNNPGEAGTGQRERRDEREPATESLLDQLARHRGRRAQPVSMDSDDIPAAHPARPEDAHDATVLAFPQRGSSARETGPSPMTGASSDIPGAPEHSSPQVGSSQAAADDTPASPGSDRPAAADATNDADMPRHVDAPGEGELDFEVEKTAAPKRERPKRRSGRRSVPSWDEIVFGGRNSTD